VGTRGEIEDFPEIVAFLKELGGIFRIPRNGIMSHLLGSNTTGVGEAVSTGLNWSIQRSPIPFGPFFWIVHFKVIDYRII
jgi:hypothetical protein